MNQCQLKSAAPQRTRSGKRWTVINKNEVWGFGKNVLSIDKLICELINSDLELNVDSIVDR